MYIDLTPSTIPIFGFFSFDLRDADVSLMNSCNECVSTLDDTPTILIRKNNCWESIRAQVAVLGHYKEGIGHFFPMNRWTYLPSGNYPSVSMLERRKYCQLERFVFRVRCYFVACFPVEDRESVRNRATTTTVGYRSTIGKNATWHAACIFPLHWLQREQQQRSRWVDWQLERATWTSKL